MRLTLLLFSGALVFAQTKAPAAKVDFETQVQPLLSQKCYSCHGAVAQQSGLRLDHRQNALRGGDYGPVIIPGKSAESKLYRRIVNGDGGLQMPPTGPLSEDEIALLRDWIDQGAEYLIEVQEDAPAKPVDPKTTALISAVRSVDTGAVEKLLAANPALIQAVDAAGSTLLHHAAGFGTLATMKLLLDKGANPNASNQRKSTPLFWAIHDEAKVHLLIDRGASVDARTNDGRTLVYEAAFVANSTSVMRLLLAKGANPNQKSLAGATPLMTAAAAENLDAMRLLLENHADVKTTNAAGATALMAAAQTGNPQAIRMLLDAGADANGKTKKNETALAYAATAGNEECVRLLLEHGADVNVTDIRGYTPLLYAAGSDAIPAGVVKLLLAKGADTTAKGDGETAQMLAAKRGDTEVARLLGVPSEVRSRLGVVPASKPNLRERTIAEAVEPALALVAKQSGNFIRIGGCNSCHAQDLPSAALSIIHDRGLPGPKLIPQLPRHMEINTPERVMDLTAVGAIGLAWELFDSGMNRVPHDQYTDAVVRYLKAMQTPAGNWHTADSRRPPMNSGPSQIAALSIFAIQHYGRPEDQAENGKAVARASAWLEASKPDNTQDRAFRILGLSWAGATPRSIAGAVKDLAGTQRPDGGWSQMVTMGSDAYATGEALYALNAGGNLPVSNAIYQQGTKYLLRTQADDGSWHVASRSIWLQPYFDSGFPYAHDQWISAAGTSWAVMALSLSAEPKRASGTHPAEQR